MMRITHRIGSWIAAGALTTGTLLAGAGAASAADEFTYKVIDDGGGSVGVAVYHNGHYAGAAYWQADPIGSVPGDTLYAVDSYTDGWGITGESWTPHASSLNYRKVSTQGHDAPYKTRYASGDLKEGTEVSVQVCIVKDGNESNCGSWNGHA